MHCRNGVGRDESSRDVYITVFRESNPTAKLAKTRLVICFVILVYLNSKTKVNLCERPVFSSGVGHSTPYVITLK